MGEQANPKWTKTGERLGLLVATTGMREGEFVATIDIEPKVTAKAWSKYRKGKRELPVELAGKLFLDHGASMEWLYLGIAGPNSDDFKRNLARVMQAGATPPAKASRVGEGLRPASARKPPRAP